jgi:hypothetical protein
VNSELQKMGFHGKGVESGSIMPSTKIAERVAKKLQFVLARLIDRCRAPIWILSKRNSFAAASTFLHPRRTIRKSACYYVNVRPLQFSYLFIYFPSFSLYNLIYSNLAKTEDSVCPACLSQSGRRSFMNLKPPKNPTRS